MAAKKKPAKKLPKAPQSPRSAKTSANAGLVTVRMYRQGLGDCHLISFGTRSNARHILIDCGTLGATTTGVKLADVVQDIHDQTGGHLDLVIATHEHHDHLSGFGSLDGEFKKFTVDHVWLAWTENPADKIAQQLAKNKEDLGTALTAASRMLMKSSQEQSKARGMAIEGLLGFFGDSHLGVKFSKSVNDAMNFVRKELTIPATFKNPGDGPLEEPWLPGFRFYVLGPPKSIDALNDTGEKGSSELYGISAGLLHATRFHMAGANIDQYATKTETDADERERFEHELPFDARFRFEKGDPRVKNWFATNYDDAESDWRRIDSDWLHVASDLALQLDSSTNNTSLALAIERISDGKVLLFPADAQQGNWLSWHNPEMKWIVKDDGGKERGVTAADLLSRTVFYKVGHHASHNATAKAKGLELMQSDELVAFIPMDRAVALTRNPPGSWRMPARPLYLRLLQKCEGRVLRSDLGWADDSKQAKNRTVEKEFDNMATAADWNTWKAKQAAATNIKVSDLFIEYTLA